MRQLLRGPLVRMILVLALGVPMLAVSPSAAHAGGYDVRATVINTTIAQLGKPYIYAAAGPNSFDCSGLVQYCYGSAGIYVPHQSGLIWSRCDAIPVSSLEPGDLVFRTNLADPSQPPTQPANIRHVGIYVGGGQVIHAPSAGKNVSYTAVTNFPWAGRLKKTYWPQQDNTYDQPPLVTGDFTGDGREDVCYLYGRGGASCDFEVLPSSGTVLGPSQDWFASTGWYWDRTKTAAADVNGDGRTDLLALYAYGTDTVKLWAFISDGDGFLPAVWWSSAAGGWSWANTRLFAADFNADGRGDVALVRDDGADTTRVFVLRSTGAAFYPPRLWWASGAGAWDARRSKFAAGDLTGDGNADLAVLYDRGRGASDLRVLAAEGSHFYLGRSAWYSSPLYGWDWNKTKLATGDLNGDRKQDAVLLFDAGGSTSRLWAFLSNGAGFSARNVFWTSAPGQYEWERARLGTGDFDREGRDDVTVLYDLTSGSSKLSLFDSTASGGSNGVTNGWFSPIGAFYWNRVR